MTITCSTGSSIGGVRWQFLRDGTSVIPQISLAQGSDCLHTTSSYGGQDIIVTLCSSFSTLSTVASDQLNGIHVECILISGAGTEREIILVEVIRKLSLSILAVKAHACMLHCIVCTWGGGGGVEHVLYVLTAEVYTSRSTFITKHAHLECSQWQLQCDCRFAMEYFSEHQHSLHYKSDIIWRDMDKYHSRVKRKENNHTVLQQKLLHRCDWYKLCWAYRSIPHHDSYR